MENAAANADGMDSVYGEIGNLVLVASEREIAAGRVDHSQSGNMGKFLTSAERAWYNAMGALIAGHTPTIEGKMYVDHFGYETFVTLADIED